MSRPPRTEAELAERARSLAGMTLQQLARASGVNLPDWPRNAKGWIGSLAETWLGATASNLPEPDFQYIGVELKTVPIGANGRPRESTYVCSVPLMDTAGLTWEASAVCRKLNRVLWLPVEADPTLPFAERRFGSAVLWSPDPGQSASLRRDWEELMELVVTGGLDSISSRHGRVLQIRPKAANARARAPSFDEGGIPAPTLPRGFYLRASFTWEILREHLGT